MIGNSEAKAMRPKPSSAGFRPGIVAASPRPRAVTSGTVTVEVVTPPESYAQRDEVFRREGGLHDDDEVAGGHEHV